MQDFQAARLAWGFMIWTLLRIYIYGMFTAFGLYSSCLLEAIGTVRFSAVHWLLLIATRPHADKIGGFLEIMTCTAEMILLLGFMLDYQGGVDVPIAVFIVIVAAIVGGQVALSLQVCHLLFVCVRTCVYVLVRVCVRAWGRTGGRVGGWAGERGIYMQKNLHVAFRAANRQRS